MKRKDLSKQLSQGNRLHKIKLYARPTSASTMVLCTRTGGKRVSLGLPALTIDSKGMTQDESHVIRQAMAMRDETESKVDAMGVSAVKLLQSKGRKKASEVLAEWAESFAAKQTKSNCRLVARLFLEHCGDMQIARVSRESIHKVMEALRKKGSHVNYVRYQGSRLRAFCNWAESRGYMGRVDTRNLLPHEQFGEVKALSREELARLAATPIEVYQDVKDRFLLGVYTAQRLGEISRYTFSILENKCIRVRQGKTGKWIKIPLTQPAIRLLEGIQDRLKSAGRPHGKDDCIFQCLPSSPTIARCFDRWLESAGVDPSRVRPKNSRSTAISLLINAGVDQSVAQELANHSDPKTTARYYRQIDDSRKREALETIPDFLEC